MGLPGIQMWTWTLCVLSWMCVGQVVAGPQYLVAIPAVLEAGAETKLCASLLQPNETLDMTVTLMSQEQNTTLLRKTTKAEFHSCVQFQVPLVPNQVVQKLEVELRGDNFYSKEVRKVMIKVYQPMTFVQTDKPIYLPGQTVHFRVVTLDTKLRPASQLYNTIEIEDPNNNRIGQWLNKTSNGKILQLSYSLNSEAREGTYQVIVSIGKNKVYHRFKVEKYVLPKFDVKINASDEVSIDQEEIKAEVCAKYTYGQPVPGSVQVHVCRPLDDYIDLALGITPEHPEGDPDITAPCYNETKQTDKRGCATFTFGMSTFTKLDQKVLQDSLVLSAKVEEEGTGILYQQEKRIGISYVVGKLSFIDTPKIYDQGSNVEGKVKAVHYNNTPIPDMPVYLFEGERWSARLVQNLTTDSDGIATFSFNSADLKGGIHLHVGNKPKLDYVGFRMPYYEVGDQVLSAAEPPSPVTKTVSTLEVKKKDQPIICDREEDISIKYTVVGETQGSVDVMYLVLSRGAILMQGVKKVEVQDKSVTEGEVSFKLTVSAEMAPEVQVVAYAVLPSETVIANSADFSTEKCFSHKVSLEFSPSSAVPGEETILQVTAQPDSLCGVSAVDQSVLIKEPGKTLNADKIFALLPVRKAYTVPYEIQDPEECLHLRHRRYVPYYHGQWVNEDDAHSVFWYVGLKMATNLALRVPSCIKYKGREYHHGHYGIRCRYESVPQIHRMDLPGGISGFSGLPGPPGLLGLPTVPLVGSGFSSPPQPVETVRTFFPETWIWDLVEVGESGTKDVSLTVPDTITTWETEAFCLSPQGFGLAPRKDITVFQPFFLELSLPYSIIRGEHFELKATTFNYLSSCIMVTVTPAPSLDYTLTPLSGDQYTSCLCGSERKTLSWTMAPSALGVVNVSVTAEAVASHTSCDNEIVSVPERGRIDVVTRSLIVKAEGTEITKTYNFLLCPKGEAVTEEIDIQLPENMIDGSARASLSVLGDILGRALKNLDGLLKMPYGCGEQNMALLAPNIYILQYLENTQQLTAAIKEKATNFLTSGYQRQLNYKHFDGAYSTFGSGPGNTWLTAFVLRSFAKAQSFIYIDPTKLAESKSWLDGKQRENGCFQQLGKLFNNRMKGGVSDEVTLSAYITAAYLEMNTSVNDPVVNKSLSCLRESISDLSNTYTTALLAYVFTLAGETETRAHLLKHLDTVASKQGGFLYWSQTATETSASLSVEISSYVLLARLSGSPTAEDLGAATSIVRWLTGQQNYYGGFSSTQYQGGERTTRATQLQRGFTSQQSVFHKAKKDADTAVETNYVDTVVALQALALYATAVFSPEGSSTVTVQSPSGQLTFDVNQNNKLLYQEKLLQQVTGKFSLEVKGSACASVQISLHYNIPTPAAVTTLSVEVKPEADCTSLRPKLTLKLKSLYSGKESTTNMVILDIKMLSGFVPDPESLRGLKGALLVDRVEEKEDHVLVYIRELTKDIAINHSLDLQQELPVQNLKPAVVKIYDYYQPSDQAETEYIYPCAAD
ncbi:alpha-2-macroglobulin-like isoform X2 [Micropterus salmoides]|uniref:alpha-2-macroglobulin-like isoform X2 n=1 Tax=Micropterus salmoides TaxID=27706 RepID=UPI0018ECAFD5|nr:alpha-2-macroglobulin-like isoform X2 [Micropterus salmoides]